MAVSDRDDVEQFKSIHWKRFEEDFAPGVDNNLRNRPLKGLVNV
jgi:hypothetical protein